jgi:hypothetical protein
LSVNTQHLDCVYILKLLYAFFWVIPRRLNFICRRFGTPCLFHISYPHQPLASMWVRDMEQTECFETSAYKIQTSGNYPEENIKHSEHGKSLKSRTLKFVFGATAPPLPSGP